MTRNVLSWPPAWLRSGHHLWLGLVWIVACEIALFADVEAVAVFFTPLVWWGYIVAVDGAVRRLRGRSLLVDAPGEFRLIAAVSTPLWLIFEYYNLYLDNWHYVGLPGSPELRLLGYAASFASILPALLETADLVAAVAGWEGPEPQRREPGPWGIASMVVGAAMLVFPLVFPSRYVFAPVWLGFIFLLDPLNGARGMPSFLVDLRRGSTARAAALLVGGFLCGFLWEFWNYWAGGRWVYTVPFTPEWRIFEMPVLGFLGFGPFALEMYALYLWVRGRRPWDVAPPGPEGDG